MAQPANKGGGAKAGGKKGGGFNPARIAAQQIKLAEQPVHQQIAAERAANLARAQAQMGFAKAAAAIMQQAAPNVQQGYTDAANADAGYSKGLGNIVQGSLDKNAQSSNSFLANMGTPQAGLQAAPPVGDLAYGTGGYIPATALQREGAAWGAEAQLAPGNVLGRGQQEAAATLTNDPNLAALQTELAKIAATEPDVYRQIVNTYEQRVYQQQQLRQSQQRIRISEHGVQLRAQQQQNEAAYRQASLQMEKERIGLTRSRDRAAIRTAIAKGERPDASLSKVYGYVVDYNGNAILNRGKKIPVKTSNKSGLGPSFYPGQKNPNGAGLYGAGSAKGAFGVFGQANYAGVDQGVDYSGAGHIPALGRGVVTDVGTTHIRQGYTVPYIVYKLTSGPHRGQYVYVVENFSPSVRVGQVLRPGDSVGIAHGTYPYIETGFNQTAKGWTAYGNLDGPQSQGYAMLRYINRMIRKYGGEIA